MNLHAHFGSPAGAVSNVWECGFWWSLCTLYVLACQVKVTIGDSGIRDVVFMCMASLKR